MSAGSGELEGKVALVTGARGDLGSALVRALVEAGTSVAGVVREPGLPPDGRVLWIRADVRNEREVRRAVSATLGRFGKIDILVNNAGVRGPTTSVTKLSLRAWREVMDTNLTGPFLFARECLKHMMRRREGRVVNISSVVGRWAYPLRASYAASKAGLISLTWTLAQEAGAAHVQVNAVCPGPVAGQAIAGVLKARARALGVSTRQMERRFMRPSALGRMVMPEDVTQAVLFLCSDAARNVTGQVIDVSAGYGLYPGM